MRFLNGTYDKFREFIRGKSIICFGAGKFLDYFFDKCPIGNQIKAVLDNDKQKQGTMRAVMNKSVPIISPKEIASVFDDNIVIVVTASNIGADILAELDDMEIIKDTPVFYGQFIYWDADIKEALKVAKLLPQLKHTFEPIIPKIIHYAWFGNNPIPVEQQRYIDGWKRFCPDYEIKLWNEKNYDIEKNNYMKQAYEQKAWGFVPDYLRKDVVYEYGGIYFDTDVELVKSLDELLYQKGFCGIESGNQIAFGLGFGAVKGLPIMKELRDIYDNENFKYIGSKTKAAPKYETEIFMRHGFKKNGKYQIVADMTVYPREVLSGEVFWNEAFITKNTVSVHHYAGSWLDEITTTRNKNISYFYSKVEQL